MDKEKQIEEIYEQIKYGTGSYSDDARSVAEILYDIGYRKQGDVAKEIFDEIDSIISNLRDTPFYSCSDAVYELTELKKKYTGESGNDEK